MLYPAAGCLIATGFLVVVSPRLSAAQCPDGTPPPCRSAAPVRRAPPLDDRTWIVLPFENIARAEDIDWLREASVNLLYLDLSKWQDIRVIDDERVADLMRDVPRTGQLGLQTGLQVARRAGAGKLVMGDLLKVGTRTAMVAKVFDVRSGQRLRSVREESPSSDSLMPAFARLARGILNVPPSASASLSAVGTTSLGAYQAYVAGVAALNAWDLSVSAGHFTRALQADSAFALAHYKLSVVLGWGQPNDRTRQTHAEAAARLSGSLPPRERALVNGQLAQVSGRWDEACAAYSQLLRTDSLDVEAWYNLGECSFHDNAVVPLPGDTTRFVFRTSHAAAIRAFQRALELDPTYHLAFQHIQDALQAPGRGGCLAGATGQQCGPENLFQSVVLRSGDTIVTTPVRVSAGTAEYGRQQEEARRTRSHRTNLEQARTLARRWLDAGPGEVRARLAYAHILLRLGDLNAAAEAFARVGGAPTTTSERITFAFDRIELAFKLGNWADARRVYDSAYSATDTVGQARLGISLAGAAMGTFSQFDSNLTQVQAPPGVLRYFRALPRTLAGVISPDTVVSLETEVMALFGGRAPAQAVQFLTPTLVWGPRPRSSWPATDTSSRDPRVALASVAATGDVARTRRSLASFDSLLAASGGQGGDNGGHVLSASVHLALGDTAGAAEQLLAFERRLAGTGFTEPLTNQISPSGLLWGRAWLMTADLLQSTGRAAEAAPFYRRVVGLWERGDPEVQPAVARARQALGAQ